MQTVNRSFLFAGNFPVFNSSDGLFNGQQDADFTINGRVLYEFDAISLRFDAFNGNMYYCNISAGRPYVVEFNIGGLAALIELIKNRKNTPQGQFLPLAVTAYNQNSLQYQFLGFVSVAEDKVTFYAYNGTQQKEFAMKGNLQIEMFLGYLESLQKLAIEAIVGKELIRYNNRTTSNVAPTTTATPATSAPATSAPTTNATPTTAAAPATSAPTTNATPTTAAAPTTSNNKPTIDMPEINI